MVSPRSNSSPRRSSRWTFDAELLVVRLPDGDLASVEVPADVTDEVRRATPRKPFGSVRVQATIRDVTWSTVLVPDKASGTFALPVKKKVRDECDLDAGDRITVTIEVGSTP